MHFIYVWKFRGNISSTCCGNKIIIILFSTILRIHPSKHLNSYIKIPEFLLFIVPFCFSFKMHKWNSDKQVYAVFSLDIKTDYQIVFEPIWAISVGSVAAEARNRCQHYNCGILVVDDINAFVLQRKRKIQNGDLKVIK